MTGPPAGEVTGCDDSGFRLARGWGRKVFVIAALYLYAFPCLNLQRLIYFGKVECPTTNAANPKRRARLIELPVGEIRIAVTVAEDAMTIAAIAVVKRLRFLRGRSIKRDAPHRAMMEIAQREELWLGIVLHASSRQRVPRGQTHCGGKAAPPKSVPELTVHGDLCRSAERAGQIQRIEFDAVRSKLPCRGLKRRTLCQ